MLLLLVLLAAMMLLLGVCAIAAVMGGARAERFVEQHQPERVHYLPAARPAADPSVTASG